MQVIGGKILADFKRKVRSINAVIKTVNRIVTTIEARGDLTWKSGKDARANFAYDRPTFVNDRLAIFKEHLNNDQYRIAIVFVYVEGAAVVVFAGTHDEYNREFGGTGNVTKADEMRMEEKARRILAAHRRG